MLDGEVDRFWSAALGRRIQDADAIKAEWLFLGRRRWPLMQPLARTGFG